MKTFFSDCWWILDVCLLVTFIMGILPTCEGLDAESQSKLYRRSKELKRLRKVLGSIDEQVKVHEEKMGFLNSALMNMERDTNEYLGEHIRRRKIADVLLQIDHTTNNAINLPVPDKRSPQVVAMPPTPKPFKRRVFIPKGWMYCTVKPPKCYSSHLRRRFISIHDQDSSEGRYYMINGKDKEEVRTGLDRVTKL